LKFGLYYSQSQDWTHPGGAIYGYKEGDQWDPAHQGSYDEYLKKIAVPQVREILTAYQPDVLWWDTPTLMTAERAQPLAELLKLRPGIIHNNRLGGGYEGDTETPEQFVPPTGFPGRDWETCMTMNGTWGFKSNDHNWKPLSKLITNLVDIVSKGGNYLLNVGPDATGKIPDESVQLLKQVGAWMKVNGEAIYGTHASPFKRLPWGRCTVKADGKDSILYLHVLDWADAGHLLLPGLKNPVKSATVLANGTKLEVQKSEFGPVVVLQGAAPDAISSTLVVRIEGSPEIQVLPVIADADGVIRLTPSDAELHGKSLSLGQRGGKEIITKWENPEDSASWEIQVTQAGNYSIDLTAAAADAGSVIRIEGLGKFACTVPKTDNLNTFKTTRVGEVALKKGQKITVRLQPVVDGWKPVNLQSVALVP
jgi:alpha-L-fucosidase